MSTNYNKLEARAERSYLNVKPRAVIRGVDRTAEARAASSKPRAKPT